METPLISVIVPVYNCVSTVEETVNSVLMQQCNAGIEVILVNDASTDSTKKVIDQIAKKNLNVIVKNRQTSSGRPSIPRNEGLDLSKGDFVCFMDSDDIMPIGYLASVMNVLQKDNEFVGSLKHPFSSSIPKIKPQNIPLDFMTIPKWVQCSKNVFTTSGLVIPRRLIDDLRFENIYLEDWRFLLQLYDKKARGKLLFAPRIFYRDNFKSLTPKNKKFQMSRVISVHKENYGNFLAFFFLLGYLVVGGIKLIFESKVFCRS